MRRVTELDYAFGTGPVDGFELVRAGDAHVASRPEATAWARKAVCDRGSLYRAARETAIRTLSGRGPVPVVANPIGDGLPWVVRHYRRGGWARLLKDRYLRWGRPRSLRELETSARLRELNIVTPRVMAAAIYTMGPYYRADLVTELVPQACDLADVLLGNAETSSQPWTVDQREEAIACTVDLVERMAAAGVYHPDFNAKNILVSRDRGGIRVSLIDLDRCRVTGPSTARKTEPLLRRLTRSIRKLERARSGRVSDHEINLIHGGASLR